MSNKCCVEFKVFPVFINPFRLCVHKSKLCFYCKLDFYSLFACDLKLSSFSNIFSKMYHFTTMSSFPGNVPRNCQHIEEPMINDQLLKISLTSLIFGVTSVHHGITTAYNPNLYKSIILL